MGLSSAQTHTPPPLPPGPLAWPCCPHHPTVWPPRLRSLLAGPSLRPQASLASQVLPRSSQACPDTSGWEVSRSTEVQKWGSLQGTLSTECGQEVDGKQMLPKLSSQGRPGCGVKPRALEGLRGCTQVALCPSGSHAGGGGVCVHTYACLPRCVQIG